MGVRILTDPDQRLAALYCSTSDWAFGPVFYGSDDKEPDERAEAFLRWIGTDLRRMDSAQIESAYTTWMAQESAQYQREYDSERLAALEPDEDILDDDERAELIALRAKMEVTHAR